MPSLTLYDYPIAYNPAKARLALLERGLPFRTKFVNLFNGQSLDPSYIRVNSNGTAPTLVVEGGPTLCDSKDIINYVNTVDGGFAATDADKGFVSEWVDKVDDWDGNLFLEANVQGGAKKVLSTLQAFKLRYAEARKAENPDLAEAYTKKIAKLKEGENDPDPAAVSANTLKLTSLLETAEQRLGQNKWLAGASYCIADVLLTVVLWRIEMGNQQNHYIAPRPNLSKYFSTVKARPSYATAFGPANGVTTAKLLVSAFAKAKWCMLFNRF